MDESAAVVFEGPAEPSEIHDLAASFELFVDAESARFHGALRLLTRDRAEAEDPDERDGQFESGGIGRAMASDALSLARWFRGTVRRSSCRLRRSTR
jgi:hypothetical protein